MLLQRGRQTLWGFTWDHFAGYNVFPSSVLIVYAHPSLAYPRGAAGPTAGQVFAGGIFIAVH